MNLSPTITKKFPSGAWEVCDIICGHLVTRIYYYYTKREALQEFHKEFSKEEG